MKAIWFINDFKRGNYERRISEKTQKSKSIACDRVTLIVLVEICFFGNVLAFMVSMSFISFYLILFTLLFVLWIVCLKITKISL